MGSGWMEITTVFLRSWQGSTNQMNNNWTFSTWLPLSTEKVCSLKENHCERASINNVEMKSQTREPSKIYRFFKKLYSLFEPLKQIDSKLHSRFGHYFCSNLYGRAPRGVKKSVCFVQIKLLSFCARIAPKRHKLRKIVKIEKKCQKNLVFLEYFEYSSIWGQY